MINDLVLLKAQVTCVEYSNAVPTFISWQQHLEATVQMWPGTFCPDCVHVITTGREAKGILWLS